MIKRLIVILILLLAVGTLVFWFAENRKNKNDVSDNVVLSVAAYNQTQNTDATSVTAKPNDMIVYTLSVENTSDDVIPGYVVETNISDVSELANLIDAAGASYNAGTSALMWTPLDIPAQNSITRQFTVQVKENLPAGTDMTMKLSFNNEVVVAVGAQQVAGNKTPTPTPNPGSSYEAPSTGPSLWFAFILGLVFTLGVVLYRTARRINV